LRNSRNEDADGGWRILLMTECSVLLSADYLILGILRGVARDIQGEKPIVGERDSLRGFGIRMVLFEKWIF
jgi:hypothetical protein